MDKSHCFNLAMRKSSRLITQFYEERLAEAGLKVGQFSILRAVANLQVTSNKQLQSILVLDQTTLSRNLKPLIRDGFLNLSRSAEDSRLKQISLSDSGKALYLQALPLWQAAQDELIDKMGAADAAKMLKLADKFVQVMT